MLNDDDGDRVLLAMAFSVMIALNAFVSWELKKIVFQDAFPLLLAALASIARFQVERRRGVYETLSNA